MATDKKTNKNAKTGPKGPRRPLEERAQILRAKLADMEMRIKIKSDPEKSKLVRKIRGLQKEEQTPAILAAIKELRAKL